MRHHSNNRKFGRKRGQRRAFLRGLMASLILAERIVTTEARAKELRPQLERLVTHAKAQTPSSLRLLMRYLPKDRAFKLYHEIVPRYASRSGGYLRIHKLTKVRRNDGAKKAVIEFV